MFSSQSSFALDMEIALDTSKSTELANLFKAACVLYSLDVCVSLAGSCLLNFKRNTFGKTIQLPAHAAPMFTICICGRLVITAGE